MTRSRLVRIAAFVMATVLLISIATVAFAYNTIPYGEQSDAVRKMQKSLRSKGYYRGSVDGKFGPSTKAAVQSFQKAVGLKGDGRPGHKTLTALYDGISTLNKTSNTARKQTTKITNPRSLYYGCTGSRVSSLQQALRKAGYFKAPIDGVYGDLTYAAVRRYQSANGLGADGIAGVRTLARLNGSKPGSQVGTSMQLSVGSTGNEVKRLQQMLDAEGFTNEDDAGVFGESTRKALVHWQAHRQYETTGTFSESDYNTHVVD